jgi:hypothetical protein
MMFKVIANMVELAESHAASMSAERISAIEYERGEMKDTPSEKGRSSVVSRDVRAANKKVLPSLMRTILGCDQVVEFQPVSEGDEEAAQQATDYVNLVLLHETDAARHIESAIHDALVQRNGILKWWYDEKRTARVSYHTGIPEDALATLTEDAEVIEAKERVENTDMGPVTVFDLRIKRIVAENRVKIAAVPRERFLIHPDAVDLQDSPIVGEKTTLTRSDLIAMGYDRDGVMAMKTATDDDYEEAVRRDTVTRDDGGADMLNQEVDYYDLFVRIDADDDGIAELHHMCFAGGLKEDNLLRDDPCDAVQFCDIKVFARPHSWEGTSLYDDIRHASQIKTVLLRSTLDNLYHQNSPQPIYQDGTIMDLDALYNPEFGRPMRVAAGTDVRAALGYTTVPFVAEKSFGMLQYLDDQVQEWTGVSDASGGLAPDALQNVTAKASALMEAQGIGQVEMMARTVAGGLKDLFRGLLRLTIRHQDVPRMVRLRGKWVSFDPRDWNSDMDCKVNTGLGAGTRERDMQMMMFVTGMQEKLLTQMGPNNPFVKPENLWNALSRLVESAGLKTPSMYFTEPDPAEVAQMMKSVAEKPNPEMEKIRAQMQIEQMKMQGAAKSKQADGQIQMQLGKEKQATAAMMDKAKMEVQANKELAQLQADLKVREADRQTQIQLEQMRIDWEREKLTRVQAAEMAAAGLALGSDGKPVNVMGNAMEALNQVVTALAQQVAMGSRPKRVVRDAAGEVIGVEIVDQVLN